MASGLLSHPPMNHREAAPLPEILTVLESISAALRSADQERTSALQGRARELLRSRPLDCGDRMILGKVLGRIRKAVGGLTFVQDLETVLPA